MPELPEVETVRSDLERKITGHKIKSVKVNHLKIIKGSVQVFKKILAGNSFKSVSRIGKLLIFKLAKGDYYLLLHLKMTGQLIYQKGRAVTPGGHSNLALDVASLPNKHTHVIFNFTDGGRLFFNDLRKFGYLKLVDESGKLQAESRFGVDPLSRAFTPAGLKNLIGSRRAPIKNILLNQELIAGIGNIYADEACFLAGVRPNRPTSSLKPKEIANLVKSIKSVLKKAIKYRGTTFNNFRDSDGHTGNFLKFLNVYHRAGELCRKCKKAKIAKIKTAGRGTHFCPHCQSYPSVIPAEAEI